jgi:hypothetical protein
MAVRLNGEPWKVLSASDPYLGLFGYLGTWVSAVIAVPAVVAWLWQTYRRRPQR